MNECVAKHCYGMVNSHCWRILIKSSIPDVCTVLLLNFGRKQHFGAHLANEKD